MNKILEEINDYLKCYPEHNNEILPIIEFVKNQPQQNKELLVVSHLGLGDNFTSSGGVRYLSFFYNKVYIFAKPNYFENVIKLYSDNPKINVISGFDDDKLNFYQNFLEDVCHIGLEGHYSTRYSNFYLNQKFRKDSFCDHFLSQMYKNAFLDMKIFSDFFYIPNTEKSQELYNSVKNYKTIFVHEQSSTESSKFEEFINQNEENTLVVCSNRNYYTQGVNFELAQQFINIPLIDYYETILNSKKIYIIDSCFSCIVIPSLINKTLKTDKVYIRVRQNDYSIKKLHPQIKTF